ncbi:ion channel [Aliiroseovarius sp. 2305UL8-7]|uniref:ion channel n=1 Tax=Aliiroseovarius conchicola TaxID=3121637 RepID=UPI0035278EE3
MFFQLLVGSALTHISLVLAAGLWWMLSSAVSRLDKRLNGLHHGARALIVIVLTVSTAMIMMTVGVWSWALVYYKLMAFPTLEDAAYVSLVAYTTLGLGDIELPHELRFLGGMTGANGFLMFGLMTAMLTDTLRNIRRGSFDAD